MTWWRAGSLPKNPPNINGPDLAGRLRVRPAGAPVQAPEYGSFSKFHNNHKPNIKQYMEHHLTMPDHSSYNQIGLRIMEVLLESAARKAKSDHLAIDEITVTVIAGQVHRWCGWPVRRLELYSFRPGDLLRVWVPPKRPESDQQT